MGRSFELSLTSPGSKSELPCETAGGLRAPQGQARGCGRDRPEQEGSSGWYIHPAVPVASSPALPAQRAGHAVPGTPAAPGAFPASPSRYPGGLPSRAGHSQKFPAGGSSAVPCRPPPPPPPPRPAPRPSQELQNFSWNFKIFPWEPQNSSRGPKISMGTSKLLPGNPKFFQETPNFHENPKIPPGTPKFPREPQNFSRKPRISTRTPKLFKGTPKFLPGTPPRNLLSRPHGVPKCPQRPP